MIATTVSADERDPADEAARLKEVRVSGDAFAYDCNQVAGPFSDGYYRIELPVTRSLRERVAAEYRDALSPAECGCPGRVPDGAAPVDSA